MTWFEYWQLIACMHVLVGGNMMAHEIIMGDCDWDKVMTRLLWTLASVFAWPLLILANIKYIIKKCEEKRQRDAEYARQHLFIQ
jgi:preprotein translocase subunit SecG